MKPQTTHPDPNQRPIALLVGLVGLLTGGLSAVDWLCTPAVTAQMWPADVQVAIVGLLGGQSTVGMSGYPESQLSVTSVLLRMIAALVFFLIVGRLCQRTEPLGQQCDRLLLRVGGVGLIAGAVWVVQLFAFDAFLHGLLPPVIMMLAGAALYGGLSISLSQQPGGWHSRAAVLALIAGTLAWIAVSFRLNERLYANLLIPHGDSAMYEEHLWNVWHGKGFRSYLDQGLFLGEHIQVIHLLLLPFHIIWPTHLTLELAESIALGSCTLPLFLMVRRQTGHEGAACLLALSWLLFFPMHFLDIAIDQKTFRPICLGLPALFWMLHTAEIGRYRTAWLCLLLALSAKEDMALITAPLATVIALLAWRSASGPSGLARWGVAAALFSAAWLLLTVLIVIPAFRSGAVVHYSRYFGDLGSSPGELMRTAFTRPDLVLAQVASLRTALYCLIFLAPLAFVSVWRPLHLLAGSLTFLMLSLIQLGDSAAGSLPPVPYHHFHAPLLPVLFWAAASALTSFRAGPRTQLTLRPATPAAAALLVFCCCLMTGICGSNMPTGASYWSSDSALSRHALYHPRPEVESERRLIERAEMARTVVDRIPLSSRVAATDFIHTRLTHCERSYDYSDYERVVNEPGQRIPADCEYIVIDTGHRYSTIRQASDVPELQAGDEWTLLPDDTNGCFLVLKRDVSQP